MRRSTKQPGGFFSLVELLVVIAIISMLMALLLPALKRAKDIGYRSQCMGQAKQMGVGVVVYSDDYNGWMPNAKHYTPCHFGLVNLFLGDYFPKSMIRCPIDKTPSPMYDARGVFYTSYGYQQNIGMGNPPNWLYADGHYWTPERLANVPKPSRVPLVGDNPYTFGGTPGTWQYPNSGANGSLSERHARRGNVLWVDGHVSAETCKSINDDWFAYVATKPH